MQRPIRRKHDAQVRAHAVCIQHRALFDASPGGARRLADFGTQVADVTRLLAEQKEAIQQRRIATHNIRRLRRALRETATVIVKIARFVAVDKAVLSAIQAAGHSSDTDLAAYAQGLINLVAPHAELFLAEGLPANVLDDFGGLVQQFAAAREAQGTARRAFTIATGSILDTQERTGDSVDALEAIAVATPAAHPELLRNLRIAKRIGPRVTAPEGEPAPPSPPPEPTDKAA